MTTDQRSRKEIAVDFLQKTASGHAREAFLSHVGRGFRHHNPSFHGDAESLAMAMDENAAKYPRKSLEVLRALEDDDLVVVHARVRLAVGQPEVAVVHIYRFEGDAIVELWDVAQPAPDKLINEKGMF